MLPKEKRIAYVMKGLKILQYCDKNPQPVPPIDIIKNIFKKRHIPWYTFTNNLNLTPQEKEQFWNGEVPITEEIALALEDFLELPYSGFWLTVEEIYQRRKNA